MNAPNNPFAVQGKQIRGPGKGTVFAWLLTLAAIAGAGFTAHKWWETNTALEGELSRARVTLAEREYALASALGLARTNHEVITSLTNHINELQKEKEAVGQKARTLEDEMREQLESKDVTISKLQGKLTVTIVDRVMFDSGEAVLKEDGAAVMQKIADLLTGHPELNIHVIGHTDNVPIRQTVHSRFASNWELSTARALAAVHFLTEKAGVDPRRVGAVGYGEFRPIADNSTPEGRAKNRRIAVTLLPEELAAVDTEPLAQTSADSNTNAVSLANPEAITQ